MGQRPGGRARSNAQNRALTDVVGAKEDFWDEEALVVHEQHLVRLAERFVMGAHSTLPPGGKVGQDIFLHDSVLSWVESVHSSER